VTSIGAGPALTSRLTIDRNENCSWGTTTLVKRSLSDNGPCFSCKKARLGDPFSASLAQDPPMSLARKTLFITGASRGIGLAIALKAAKDGANIAVAAKTETPHPK